MTSPAERDAYVAFGSNLGSRRATIERALDLLGRAPGVTVLRVSGIIETAPVGPPGQGDYLNGVCHLRTTLSARALLDELLAIERSCGRRREPATKWGPRTLDLDLLLYGDERIDEPGLTVPHPRLAERPFVLIPLSELAPDLIVPGLSATVSELLRAAGGSGAGGAANNSGPNSPEARGVSS